MPTSEPEADHCVRTGTAVEHLLNGLPRDRRPARRFQSRLFHSAR